MDMTPQEEALRQGFKSLNRFMMMLWRLGLGNYFNNPSISQIMVLAHTGRLSGLPRRTPVNYAEVDGEIYCTAAFGHHADWYRNILANPEVEVWLPDGWYAGVAEEVPPDDPQRDAWMRAVLIASGFAAPVFAGFNPKTAGDDELAEISANYRLIRIRRTAARTGPGGPGDLAWVWPLATFGLLAMLLIKPCRRRRR